MTGTIKPFKGQDYQQLKRRHDRNNLFEDPQFLPNDSAMCYSQRAPAGKSAWWLIEDFLFDIDGFSWLAFKRHQMEETQGRTCLERLMFWFDRIQQVVVFQRKWDETPSSLSRVSKGVTWTKVCSISCRTVDELNSFQPVYVFKEMWETVGKRSWNVFLFDLPSFFMAFGFRCWLKVHSR